MGGITLEQNKLEMTRDMELLETNEAEIDLLDFFHYLTRRVKYVVLAVVLGVIVMAVYAFVLATPMYEATAQIYVVNSQDSVVNLSDLQIGSYLTSDYQLVFDTWEVNQQVIRNLNLPYTLEEMENLLKVSNPSDTRALFITVTTPDPREAALIANEYANVARQYISDVMLTEVPSTLSVALEPENPVSPNKPLLLIVGFMLGIVLSVGILFVVYILDDKIKTSTDVLKYTGMMPLAIIPLAEKENDRKNSRGR